MIIEVIRIGIKSELKTQILGSSFFSGESNSVWHMVILRESFSDLLVMNLKRISNVSMLENFVQEINKNGYKFELSRESIPCFGEEVELINFIADEILVDWHHNNAVGQLETDHYPEIVVFSNNAKNKPVIRKITTDKVDGKEVLWITVSPQIP